MWLDEAVIELIEYSARYGEFTKSNLDRCHAKIFNLSLRPLQMFQVVVFENARKFLPAERQLREVKKERLLGESEKPS
jgi:hypothetical protein